MCKSAAILCLALFASATLAVACEDPNDLPIKQLKVLAGKKLIVGCPAFSRDLPGSFAKGATRLAIQHPVANLEKWPVSFVTDVELEAPVQQEHLEAYVAFRKKYPSKKDSCIVMEVVESDLTDRNNPKVKVRLLGTAYYPIQIDENFTDADLKDQPYLPFAASKPKAVDSK